MAKVGGCHSDIDGTGYLDVVLSAVDMSLLQAG
jgi:hypothetical protein